MWKDSYKVGVSSIDDQHRELFRVTGELMRTLNEKESEDLKKECTNAIIFLKNYAVEHFADEERFQEEVKYEGRHAHKKIHQKFIKTVLEHEKRMTEAGFSFSSIKDFVGMLAAWLIYHVADEDQKIVNKSYVEEDIQQKTVMEIFETCTCGVLNATAGLNEREIKRVLSPEKGIKGDIAFVQSYAGDIMGDVAFVVTKPLALKLFEIMTTLKLPAIDDMVVASLAEIMEIIGEKAVGRLAKIGYDCSIVESNMNFEETSFDGENSMGFYTLVGNMGIHDDSVHN